MDKEEIRAKADEGADRFVLEFTKPGLPPAISRNNPHTIAWFKMLFRNAIEAALTQVWNERGEADVKACLGVGGQFAHDPKINRIVNAIRRHHIESKENE